MSTVTFHYGVNFRAGSCLQCSTRLWPIEFCFYLFLYLTLEAKHVMLALAVLKKIWDEAG